MFIKPSKHIGVGINYRSEISNDILTNIDKIDFIEINTEKFFDTTKNINLEKVIKSLPVVLHGLSLSIGNNNEPISSEYLEKLSLILKEVNCEWFSEHIAITNIQGLEIRALMPVQFNDRSVEAIANKAKTIAALTDKPFLLENITYYYSMPDSPLKESDFLREVIKQSDCGMLLDINNLYVNSVNHKYDPYTFLNELPLDRVVEIHLAGCNYIHGMLIDTHASQIRQEVLSIFDFLCKKTKFNAVVIERDDKLDKFTDLLDEIEIVRNILAKNY